LPQAKIFFHGGEEIETELACSECGAKLNGARLINGDNANFGKKKYRRTQKMDMIRKLYVKGDEFARGQTMTEYALILAAVAVVVFVGYQTMGTTIKALLVNVDSQL
jgi:Flp pilus assembly pilin Flp